MRTILLVLTCLVLCGCDSNSTQSSNSQPQAPNDSPPNSAQSHERNLGDTLAHAAVAGAAAGAAGTVAAKATDHVIDKAKRRARYKRIKAYRSARSR